MQTITNPPHKQPGLLYALMLIAAIALIVFSIVGIATMMGWVPGAAPEKTGPVPAAAPARVEPAPCADCGIVESIRATKGEAGMGPVTYQIRVRMSDGATRAFTESDRPTVVVGQRVRVTERGVAASR